MTSPYPVKRVIELSEDEYKILGSSLFAAELYWNKVLLTSENPDRIMCARDAIASITDLRDSITDGTTRDSVHKDFIAS